MRGGMPALMLVLAVCFVHNPSLLRAVCTA
jgi:hypothetical protein